MAVRKGPEKGQSASGYPGPGSQAQGDARLREGDEQVERDFAKQIFGAAHGIGEHFVEDTVIAIHDKDQELLEAIPKLAMPKTPARKKEL